MYLNKGYHLEYCLVVDVDYHPFECSKFKSKLFMKKCFVLEWVSLYWDCISDVPIFWENR